MIAIILWAIVIIVIAFSACPGFAVMLTTTLVAAGLLLSLYAFIMYQLNHRRQPDRQQAQPRIRSQDIEEWERKWKRPHPSRTINRNRKTS